ncbi:MAG: hypothetical protein HY782_21490 [Chloroflexi bacterium]|nr:hypothetical protein [Chloroflexota bacterium]
MDFGPLYSAAVNSNESDTFEFPPTPCAMLSLQPGKVPNRIADCYDFNVLNLADNFKVH